MSGDLAWNSFCGCHRFHFSIPRRRRLRAFWFKASTAGATPKILMAQELARPEEASGGRPEGLEPDWSSFRSEIKQHSTKVTVLLRILFCHGSRHDSMSATLWWFRCLPLLLFPDLSSKFGPAKPAPTLQECLRPSPGDSNDPLGNTFPQEGPLLDAHFVCQPTPRPRAERRTHLA